MRDQRRNQPDIFMDKRVLSFSILTKEMTLIEKYNDIIEGISSGEIKQGMLQKDRAFVRCWRIMKELYDYLENNKIEGIKKRNDDEFEKKIKRLGDIMEKYESAQKMSFEELREGYSITRKIISKAGYHKDEQKSEGFEYQYASDELE